MNRTNMNTGMLMFVHLILTEHEHINEHIFCSCSFIEKMGMFVFVYVRSFKT
ncbi:hypothetical protein HanRHA438_Chr17g0841031 [Helianthus annuus]|nr:hypothetical protein HanRHA438_Chr17g0841031 [Helianthus annuus]